MSDAPKTAPREGSLDAPTRHPIEWKTNAYWDKEKLDTELERVFDVCHGCRRCFNLCNAFPTLFDAVDESETMELDSVPKTVYWDVIDHCYLCDMCYMSKCPYVPPHEFNIDFPHLMLRAKAQKFKTQGVRKRDRILAATDKLGALAGIPVVVKAVNAGNRSKTGRKILEKTLGVHRDAPVPLYHSKTLRKRVGKGYISSGITAKASERTRGRVVLFTTCYGNRNLPAMPEDLIKVFEHNGIAVRLYDDEKCCGMPKLELGDLESVAKAKEQNVPGLAAMVEEGWDIVAPIPSCALMFKQELPLMFPNDPQVSQVRDSFFDPFEYLELRHKEGLLKTNFSQSLGSVSYQVPCHLRVQNIGLKTRDILNLIPDTRIKTIERCSGHDGTYAVKKEFHDAATKIARPVVRQVKQAQPDHFVSDCPMAADHIAGNVEGVEGEHPMSLLRQAYGL